MKLAILLNIDTDLQNKVEVSACGNDSACVFISAPTMAEASAMIGSGEALAREACESWKPAPVDPKPEKHYSVSSVALEDMAAEVKDFEATPEGKKFVGDVRKAVSCMLNHSTGIAEPEQIRYLAAKHKQDFMDGFMDLAGLAYQRGYKNGQDHEKAKGKKK